MLITSEIFGTWHDLETVVDAEPASVRVKCTAKEYSEIPEWFTKFVADQELDIVFEVNV